MPLVAARSELGISVFAEHGPKARKGDQAEGQLSTITLASLLGLQRSVFRFFLLGFLVIVGARDIELLRCFHPPPFMALSLEGVDLHSLHLFRRQRV